MYKTKPDRVACPSAGSHTSECRSGVSAVLLRRREIYESQEQQKKWAEKLRHFMRMMPEVWAFRRGQARLVDPTWCNTAPDLARVGFFCTTINGTQN